MIQAFKYCKSNLPKIYAEISEIALIEIKLNDSGIAVEDTIIFSKKLKKINRKSNKDMFDIK